MLFWDTRKPRDLPLDMLFWGPESNRYAFLGYQKTKGFATGYAFLGPGIQWICFFGARSPMDMLFWNPESHGYAFLKPGVPWICFFGIRSPMDMLFWGPESNGYAFLGLPENQGICHWICFFGARSPIFCIYLYQATTCKSVQVEK